MALVFWLSEPVIEPFFMLFKKWAIAKSVSPRELYKKSTFLKLTASVLSPLSGGYREAKF